MPEPRRRHASPPLTIPEWLAAYRAGASPRLLLGEVLQRARAASPPGTWIELRSDESLALELAALEQHAAQAPSPSELVARFPLYGVPFAVKDNIDIAGVATTAACPAFRHIAQATAASVRRLQAAGAVWIGKANLDQFATGLVGTRSPFGAPPSPFDATRICGGSSSGSAVAVALGLVPFSLGTDTAGSGRIPAAYNQIVGLKPTPGRVGTSGILPACRTLDCVSVFALTVEDAAHVLAVMEGPDPDDCYSTFTPGPAAWARDGKELAIGIPADVQLDPDAGYEEAWCAALDQARALGHRLVPIDFDLLHQVGNLLYGGPWVAERHSVVQSLLARDPDHLDPAVRTVIAMAERYSATATFEALYTLQDLRCRAESLWRDLDVLLVPTAPGHPTFAEVAADPIGCNARLGVYTNFVNLLGWSALALPAGTTAAGLPFGVTFIAPARYDVPLAALGRGWQRSLGLALGASPVRCRDASGSTRGLSEPASEPTLDLAVAGAHLSGLPLNGQLVERRGRLLRRTKTAPCYRLFALPGTVPPKPGLVRAAANGEAIEVEVWRLPQSEVGGFLALIAPPLGLGTVELGDGSRSFGFLCEAHAVLQATDISAFGGWRAYLQSLAAPPASRATEPHA